MSRTPPPGAPPPARPACPGCGHPIDLHTGYGRCLGGLHPLDTYADLAHDCTRTTLAMVRDARDNTSNAHRTRTP
jgi:hypothetical protein